MSAVLTVVLVALTLCACDQGSPESNRKQRELYDAMMAAPILQWNVPGATSSNLVSSPGSANQNFGPTEATKSWKIMAPSSAVLVALLRDARKRGVAFDGIGCKPLLVSGAVLIGANTFGVSIGYQDGTSQLMLSLETGPAQDSASATTVPAHLMRYSRCPPAVLKAASR
jgi:hypothetical protein